ncbi:MAG: hypothetical protein LAT64_13415 [Phycisphaerales bacterium]|nr:hypothetical protein [Planctomycetota bacterium]MCH8509754.1 hypothetical protein [Phycisphaerales bacterium]
MPDITLDAGPLRAVIDPALGCTITEFSIAGPCEDRYPLLRRAPHGPHTTAQGASFLMAPWTNRIRDARFDFQGEPHKLRPNFPDATAIHGVVRDAPWRITDRTPVSARFAYDSRAHERANFPFAFGAVFRAELAPEDLTLDLSVTNLDDRPMPAGLGHHFYLPRTLLSPDDRLELTAPVTGRYPTSNCLPTGDPVDDETCERFRNGGPIGNPGLDDVFAGFSGRAVLTWPASGIRLTMDCADAFTHLVVFTPRLRADDPASPPLPWVCVEPCTMANDGFNLMANANTDTGVRVLEPAQTLAARVRLHIERV